MFAIDISESVGVINQRPCPNRPKDVRLVKELLNKNGSLFGLTQPLDVNNPHVGQSTLAAISAYQSRVMHIARPTSRVRPRYQGGVMLGKLLGAQAAAGSKSGLGTSVPLSLMSQYEGKAVGSGPNKGECATGVQVIFIDAGKPLGLTKTWKPGPRVKGNKVAPGTAIASFKDGKYWHHTAIFVAETSDGLEVWDQWAGQPWHKRTLRFKKDMTDGSNNGKLFYVIRH